MSYVFKVFKEFLTQHEDSWTTEIQFEINRIQPETYLRLSDLNREEIYKKQLQQFIQLLADSAVGETNQIEIENWANEVSNEKVKLGLTLFQSIQHFNIIRSITWKTLEDLADTDEKISGNMALQAGKFINDFIDGIILIFTNAYTGLTNKRLRAQQEVIDELSTPVISIVEGVAVLPIIGDIDTHRAKLLMEHTLRETSRQEVDCLIMDLSGVFIVYTMVAQELFKIIDSLRLTGVEVNITGMRPELAQSVVTLGIQFNDIKIYNNLGQALKAFGIVRK